MNNLEEIAIEKIVFFIYTKQLSLKYLEILPYCLKKKVFYELEMHDKECHNNDLNACHAELLYKTCLDCDIENYDSINLTVITFYFQNHIRSVTQYDAIFIQALNNFINNSNL